MKKQLFKEEYQLYCDCNDPWCFVWFGFDIEDGVPPGEFDFYIDGKAWHGRLWERVKKAIKYIIFNDYEGHICGSIWDEKSLVVLRDFLNKCLEHIEKSKQQ